MIDPLVSIIIPTHNRRESVIRLLRSIDSQTYSNLEVIVVDDASTDDTNKAVKKIKLSNTRLKIVHNDNNLYAAGSRNIGTSEATGKYIFYVDDDNVLESRAISELVRIFEEDESIGELGLVNKSFRDKKKIFWLRTIRNMWTTRTYLPTNYGEYSRFETWDTVDVPNAFMVRMQVIKDYNISFCSKFGIMYEESDVAYRIRNAGYRIKVVRDAIIYHDVDNYMQHFIGDIRLPYVFARNRILFHSVYSTKFQLMGILLIWVWVFMIFYWYKVLSYPVKNKRFIEGKFRFMVEYLRGTIDGILFVYRGEKLVYSNNL